MLSDHCVELVLFYDIDGIHVIKQMMVFLAEKWWTSKAVNKKRGLKQTHYEPLIIEDDWISFGYVRQGESINDLQ